MPMISYDWYSWLLEFVNHHKPSWTKLFDVWASPLYTESRTPAPAQARSEPLSISGSSPGGRGVHSRRQVHPWRGWAISRPRYFLFHSWGWCSWFILILVLLVAAFSLLFFVHLRPVVQPKHRLNSMRGQTLQVDSNQNSNRSQRVSFVNY